MIDSRKQNSKKCRMAYRLEVANQVMCVCIWYSVNVVKIYCKCTVNVVQMYCKWGANVNLIEPKESLYCFYFTASKTCL